jgi:glycerate dehydrogenase
MNVVVVDSAHLAGEADFPMPALDKFGWQEYPELSAEEVAERCWRTDIIVTVDTPIDKTVIDKAFKLKLIIAAADDYSHIDLDAARARGITVCHVPDTDPYDTSAGEAICTQVVKNINAYIQGKAIHCVD